MWDKRKKKKKDDICWFANKTKGRLNPGSIVKQPQTTHLASFNEKPKLVIFQLSSEEPQVSAEVSQGVLY